MKTTLGLFVILLGTWLLWSGLFKPLLIAFGLGSCILVVLLVRRMEIVDDEGLPFHLAPRIFAYLPWLAVEVIKSNLELTRRILDPRLPLSQELVELDAGQKTDVGRVTYANSITLTPSTLTIEAESDGRFLIHAVSRESAADLRSGKMDAQVSRMEGSA